MDEAIITSPIGKLAIRTSANTLLSIGFSDNDTPLIEPTADIANRVITQLHAYFSTPTHRFTIPLNLTTTEFQKRVLQELQSIPLGETRTYQEIATILNTSPRPVGNACRNNPFPIIIPCHRVVSKTNLGGFNGNTQGRMLDIKQWLLCHEKKTVLI